MRCILLCGLFVAGCGGGAVSEVGDGGVSVSTDPHAQHNLSTLNMYRATNGLAPLQISDKLSQFSIQATAALISSGSPHGLFEAAIKDGSIWSYGFCGSASENQAPGWASSATDEDTTIDAMLQSMFDEGPPTSGDNHYANMMDPDAVSVGIGLTLKGDNLWLTNDFSHSCS